jgi:hypothetical protein
MGFNRRRMESERAAATAKETAARRATEGAGEPFTRAAGGIAFGL